MAGRFPFPVPDGWFAVATSEELAPGEVKPLRYFARDLVLFRTESGRAVVMDAHCPHLGAHLGMGGRVVGEQIQCPFHGWRFDASGQCVEIAYARRIPRGARTHCWDVLERNGMILVWHHREGKPPFFEVPALPPFGDPGWTEPRYYDCRVRSAVQELAENDHDTAHFRYVHGLEIPEIEVTYDGLTRVVVTSGVRETALGTFRTRLVRRNFGLGAMAVHSEGIPGAGTLMFNSLTPVDEENVHLRWSFTVTRNLASSVGSDFIDGLIAAVQPDIPIWEHKLYRPRPLLCDGDGPIAEFRSWARHFYSGGEDAPDGPS
jgi:nitrite reductase/ring-hydroxylating ferredoxin subunit